MEIISLISFTSSIITNISPELNIFTYEVQLDLENTKLSHVENEKLVEIDRNSPKQSLYDLSKTVEELSYIIQHLHYCIEELQVK